MTVENTNMNVYIMSLPTPAKLLQRNINISTHHLPLCCCGVLPGWEKPEMGCIMPVGGAPLAMGWGRGGGADETSGGDTPTGRGGRGSGGTPESGAAMGGMGGMGGMPGEKQI